MRNVVLRPTMDADLDFVLAAESAPENAPFILQWPRGRHAAAIRSPAAAHRVVEDARGGPPVGYVILLGVGEPDRSIEFRRLVVTEKGCGYGRAAVRAIKRLAFEGLGAHRLWLDVKEFNQRARRLYESEGFTPEGLLRECYLGERGFESVYVLSVLEGEYRTGVARSPDNRLLIRRYYEELWNRWDFALAGELVGEDVSFRGSLGVEVRGREGFVGYMRSVARAFPDFHNTVEELVAEGDRVVARLTYRGTHGGPLFDLPPTGRAVSYAGMALFRIAGGRIASGFVVGDTGRLMRELAR